MIRPDRASFLLCALLSACAAANTPAPPKEEGGSEATGGSGGGVGAPVVPRDSGGPASGGSGGADAGKIIEPAPPDAGAGVDTAGTTTVTDPGSEGDGDFMIGPDYAPAPEYTAKPGVPAGTIVPFQMKSADSKLYPGLNGPFTRNVAVYVPKQYVAGTPAPFIVAHDGKNWVPRLSATLDNLIAARKLPVMIAIMVDNGGGDSKGSERGLEYDTVSGKFAEFIETEVLPRVEAEAKVTLTKDPEGRATLGGSSGGSAAFAMGWFRPDLFRRILTYSGTYVNQQSPTNPMTPHGAWEFHEHLIPQAEPKPLRVWLEVGSNDNGAGSSAAGLHNWVLANQLMAKALAAKHYHYRFEFAKGAGHVDGKVVAQTLPEAMLWLWRGYPIQ
jgi:enterochelin esterase-like enzyme